MEIQFTTKIFKEGKTFVAYAQELDISSCGRTKEKAFANLKEAVRLFLEEVEKMGTFESWRAPSGGYPQVFVRPRVRHQKQPAHRGHFARALL